MARIKKNLTTEGLSSHIRKELAFKHYGDRTVVLAYPNMMNVVASSAQKAQRGRLADAMRWPKNNSKSLQ